MVNRADPSTPNRTASIRNGAILALKFTITGACFWYVLRQVNIPQMMLLASTLDLRWAGLATLMLVLEIPVVGLRWHTIVDALEDGRKRVLTRDMIFISAIGNFVGQILPNIAGDAVRVWLLARIGSGWRLGVTSVLIDRGIGVLVLLVLGFVTLLFPSALTALGGSRMVALETIGAVLLAALLSLALAPYVASILERWRSMQLIGKFLRAVHQVLLRSWVAVSVLGFAVAIHSLTIASIWSLGRSQGVALPVVDAMMLFTVMVAITLLPISVGGWGLRELAVTALLQSHGVPAEQALLFSVSFGLAVLIASLPGAVVWALYSPARISRSVPFKD